MTPAKAIKSELLELLATDPFYAFMAFRLEIVPDPSAESFWTDGEKIGYNPAFVERISARQIRSSLARAVCHCAHLHPWRRAGRDADRWNQACEIAVNGILKAAGYELPPGARYDASKDGMTPEAIYADYAQQKPPEPPPAAGGGAEPGQGKPEPGKPGDGPPSPCEVRDSPPEGVSSEDKKAEMQRAVVESARMASGRGSKPVGMERAITEAKQPACADLIAAVMEFAQQAARDDYSWRRPNARFACQDLYLPSAYSVKVGRFAAGIDTSGSIDDESLQTFVGALQRILDEVRPESLTVLACDTQVHTVHEYEDGADVRESYPGRGGTAFAPVFDALENDPPVAALYLTDLDGPFPSKEPEYPVLWVVRDRYSKRARPPFGQVIHIP